MPKDTTPKCCHFRGELQALSEVAARSSSAIHAQEAQLTPYPGSGKLLCLRVLSSPLCVLSQCTKPGSTRPLGCTRKVAKTGERPPQSLVGADDGLPAQTLELGVAEAVPTPGGGGSVAGEERRKLTLGMFVVALAQPR